MINIKEQRGSVTLFVVISCLFFIATVVCIQMNMDSKQISADREYRQIKTNYEKDINNADEIYSSLLTEKNIDVQFVDIAYNNINENNMNISAKIIFNSSNIDIRELKYGWINSQNIIQNLNSNNIENWTYVEKENGFNQIIATLDNVPNQGYYYLCLKLNNKEFWTPINYARNGLMLHLDAINNLGTGDNNHSTTTTTWKDLSGNGNDGLLNNFKGTDESGWQKDNIIFDGIDNWIGVNEMNYENITIEALVNYAAVGSSEISAIGNWESGGYGMVVNSIVSSSERNKNSFCININGTYKFGHAQDNVQLNKKYSLSGTYDGNIVKFWENNKKTEKNAVGTIKYPNNNTIMALGTNPKAENARGSFLNGKIYSIRVYNRALTEEEVLNNYKIDKARFNIEE